MTWIPTATSELDGTPVYPDPVSAIFQAVGAASTCWESMSGTGVFQSDRASEIAGGLVDYLRAHPLTH